MWLILSACVACVNFVFAGGVTPSSTLETWHNSWGIFLGIVAMYVTGSRK
jgi:hypothetical protein